MGRGIQQEERSTGVDRPGASAGNKKGGKMTQLQSEFLLIIGICEGALTLYVVTDWLNPNVCYSDGWRGALSRWLWLQPVAIAGIAFIVQFRVAWRLMGAR